jgi:hypothetical protein
MVKQISINQAVKDDSPRKIYITGTPFIDVYIYIYTFMYVSVYECIYVYVCTCVDCARALGIHIYTQHNKHTNRRQGLGREGGQDDQGGAVLPGPGRTGKNYIYIYQCIYLSIYIDIYVHMRM